ncbi:C4-dicarboxylate TRAP transporter substrate-binding protein [Salipiger mucosus]|uniref:Putative C4-dicarboxylate transporter periplasmic solute-binding protein n=1 Tax=Salipiger mucosus DSM 16094 TaxID=1123237 RepID=S9Q728_9RHOB|nr:C4-dicarboxylate TRAP transporter substrate-binding protein [Salipiger mucosus]EPX75842.1 putative C4-dicarboxylate transporter periplasmic solute-binding protein precursor [Salipiger mucosus DSM 16094]
MKRFTSAVLIATGIAGATPLMAADYTIRLANSLSPQEPTNQAATFFAEEVAKRTDGRVEIQVFPAQQLGSEKDVNQMMRQGAPMISVTSSGYLSDFVPDIGVLEGPYLLDDPSQFDALVDSEWFDGIKAEFEQEGITFLVDNALFGGRNMLSDEPVRAPADVEGMTVRVPPNTVFIKTFEAMGARPTTVEWAEVYSALQQNVVEAAEAPLGSLWGSKLHETRDTISMTTHFTAFTFWVINADYFSGLPEDIQQVMTEVGAEAGELATELTLEREEEYKQQFSDAGVTIVEDVDIAAFREKTASVYESFPEWTPGLYDTIRGILDAE